MKNFNMSVIQQTFDALEAEVKKQGLRNVQELVRQIISRYLFGRAIKEKATKEGIDKLCTVMRKRGISEETIKIFRRTFTDFMAGREGS